MICQLEGKPESNCTDYKNPKKLIDKWFGFIATHLAVNPVFDFQSDKDQNTDHTDYDTGQVQPFATADEIRHITFCTATEYL